MALGTWLEVLEPDTELTEKKIASLCRVVYLVALMTLVVTTAAGKAGLELCPFSWEDSAKPGAPQNEGLGGMILCLICRRRNSEVHHRENENPFGPPLSLILGFILILNSIFCIILVLGILKA